MSRMKLGDKALVVAMDHARTLGVHFHLSPAVFI